jgi:hypothetical protein
MKLLRCKLCRGEMDVIGGEHAINKKVRCRECGYNNLDAKKEPEVIVMRRRSTKDPDTN